MKILGIETSCDECAAAVVEDGKKILSNVVATQIPFHAAYNGVVPEIASRMHTEWINRVVKEALDKASLKAADIDAVAATAHPGLLGSLLVGLSFAKAFAWARSIPFIAVDHMLAHLYAPRLESKEASSEEAAYPFLGLLVSGGHSLICRADNFDDITVLGATIDDAAGEAFDKVSKHYGFGYPGGAAIEKLAKSGNAKAFNFPMPNLHKGDHKYDLSYSGLKTAVINQLDKFRAGPPQADGSDNPTNDNPADIAASFQKAAVEILLRSLFLAVEDTGLTTIVAGGGVAANSHLRAAMKKRSLAEKRELRCIFPPLELCGDNGAMVAGLAYQYLARGEQSSLRVTASARVKSFKRQYP
jgi:N6-L-threonylcarbamoyladenine synthase